MPRKRAEPFAINLAERLKSAVARAEALRRTASLVGDKTGAQLEQQARDWDQIAASLQAAIDAERADTPDAP